MSTPSFSSTQSPDPGPDPPIDPNPNNCDLVLESPSVLEATQSPSKLQELSQGLQNLNANLLDYDRADSGLLSCSVYEADGGPGSNQNGDDQNDILSGMIENDLNGNDNNILDATGGSLGRNAKKVAQQQQHLSLLSLRGEAIGTAGPGTCNNQSQANSRNNSNTKDQIIASKSTVGCSRVRIGLVDSDEEENSQQNIGPGPGHYDNYNLEEGVHYRASNSADDSNNEQENSHSQEISGEEGSKENHQNENEQVPIPPITITNASIKGSKIIYNKETEESDLINESESQKDNLKLQAQGNGFQDSHTTTTLEPSANVSGCIYESKRSQETNSATQSGGKNAYMKQNNSNSSNNHCQNHNVENLNQQHVLNLNNLNTLNAAAGISGFGPGITGSAQIDEEGTEVPINEQPPNPQDIPNLIPGQHYAEAISGQNSNTNATDLNHVVNDLVDFKDHQDQNLLNQQGSQDYNQNESLLIGRVNSIMDEMNFSSPANSRQPSEGHGGDKEKNTIDGNSTLNVPGQTQQSVQGNSNGNTNNSSILKNNTNNNSQSGSSKGPAHISEDIDKSMSIEHIKSASAVGKKRTSFTSFKSQMSMAATAQLTRRPKYGTNLCDMSLNYFPLEGKFRSTVIRCVETPLFDKIILTAILANSICMAAYQHRETHAKKQNRPESDLNQVIDMLDLFFLLIFVLECGAKIIAYGFVKGKKTYLKDAWNWLDLIVVFTGLISFVLETAVYTDDDSGGSNAGSVIKMLRVFRVLRPLRSLTTLPELKMLVNTVLASIPRLGPVLSMTVFQLVIFGILGLNFWVGVYDRRCRESPDLTYDQALNCWSWPLATDDEGNPISRPCGGGYNCQDTYSHQLALLNGKDNTCGNNSFYEQDEDLKPKFPKSITKLGASQPTVFAKNEDGYPENSGIEFCQIDSNGKTSVINLGKTAPSGGSAIIDGVYYVSNDENYNFGLTNFNNIFNAILVIFQCITLEGWTSILYMSQDAHSSEFAFIYFCILVIVGSFFLLNVALAVVWDAFQELASAEDDTGSGGAGDDDPNNSSNPYSPNGGKNELDDFLKVDSNDVQNHNRPQKNDIRASARASQHPSGITALLQQNQSQRRSPGSGNVGAMKIAPESNATTLNTVTESEVDSLKNNPGEPQSTIMSMASEGEDNNNDNRKSSNESNSGNTKDNDNKQQVRSVAFGNQEDVEIAILSDSQETAIQPGSYPQLQQQVNTTMTRGPRNTALLVYDDQILIRPIFNFMSHHLVQGFIMTSIILNIIIMTMDRWPPASYEMTYALHYLDITFTIIFAAEMVLVMLSIGIRNYLANSWHCFDGFIVVSSIIELFSGGSGPMKAFRLLRILKLAKRWNSFRMLLQAVIFTVLSMGNFTALLLLMLFVFALMGSLIFANKMKFHPDSDAPIPEDEYCPRPLPLDIDGNPTSLSDPINIPLTTPPPHLYDEQADLNSCTRRSHFDTFLWAIVTVFQCLTGENWNSIMYDGMRGVTVIGSFLFFSLMVVLGMCIIFNLFLAILMANFQDASLTLREAEEYRKIVEGLGGLEAFEEHLEDMLDDDDNVNYDDEEEDDDFATGEKQRNSEIRPDMVSKAEIVMEELAEDENNSNKEGKQKSLSQQQGDKYLVVGGIDEFGIERKQSGSKNSSQRNPSSGKSSINQGPNTSSKGGQITYAEEDEENEDDRPSPLPSLNDESAFYGQKKGNQNTGLFDAYGSRNDLKKGYNSSQQGNQPGQTTPGAGGGGPTVSSSMNVFDKDRSTFQGIRGEQKRTTAQDARAAQKLAIAGAIAGGGAYNPPVKIGPSGVTVVNNDTGELLHVTTSADIIKASPRSGKGLTMIGSKDTNTVNSSNNNMQDSISDIPSSNGQKMMGKEETIAPENNVNASLKSTTDSVTDNPNDTTTKQSSQTQGNNNKVTPSRLSLPSPRADSAKSPTDRSGGSGKDPDRGVTPSPSAGSRKSKNMSISVKNAERQKRAAERFKEYNEERKSIATYFNPDDVEREMLDNQRKGKTGCLSNMKSQLVLCCIKACTSTWFENFILGLILVSSLAMAFDDPLANPDSMKAKILVYMNIVFTTLFLIEMFMKHCAMGIRNYWSSGWNVLDGGVVIISVIDLAMWIIQNSSGDSDEGSNEDLKVFKVLRIMRALRPLRVIARNPNLKLVVNTIFASLPQLRTLMVLMILFFLIVGLVTLNYLKGAFYICENMNDGSEYSISQLRQSMIEFQGSDKPPQMCSVDCSSEQCSQGRKLTRKLSSQTSCTGGAQYSFQRKFHDVPICLAKCPLSETGTGVCANYKKLVVSYKDPITKELKTDLPDLCPGPDANGNPRQQFLNGNEPLSWLNQKEYNVMSCSSCSARYCPEVDLSKPSDSCKNACKDQLLMKSCEQSCPEGVDDTSADCQACRLECLGSCECPDNCESFKEDAALCLEQGHKWLPSLSQSFDNVFVAVLTLFEISTTEGWVDVMYSAVDARGSFLEPRRDEWEVWSIFFVFFMLVGCFLILNLCVGVIVDNFADMKASSKDPNSSILVTQSQQKWIQAQRNLSTRRIFLSLKQVQTYDQSRKKVFFFVNDDRCEAFVMLCIILNAFVLGSTTYPSPGELFELILLIINYSFAVVFFVEAVLKIYAYRSWYFTDSWNLFDFTCVIATFVGILLQYILNIQVGTLMSSIRLFRVARLLRLLRFARGLNKIFNAFLLSIPKLFNVACVLFLLLFLYSVMGVQMFAKTQILAGRTHDERGNFRNFYNAFTTLVRSATGEAWNEIMHDLSYNEEFMGRYMGQPCVSALSLDSGAVYDLLNARCLVNSDDDTAGETVNSNGQKNPIQRGEFLSGPLQCGDNIMAYIYFVTYTLFITFIVLNLVVAVILEGFEDSASAIEDEIVNLAIDNWKTVDPEYKLQVDEETAMRFINLLEKLVYDSPESSKKKDHGPDGSTVINPSDIELSDREKKFCKLKLDRDGMISFVGVMHGALRQILLKGVATAEDRLKMMEEIRHVENQIRSEQAGSSVLSALGYNQAAQELQHEINNSPRLSDSNPGSPKSKSGVNSPMPPPGDDDDNVPQAKGKDQNVDPEGYIVTKDGMMIKTMNTYHNIDEAEEKD